MGRSGEGGQDGPVLSKNQENSTDRAIPEEDLQRANLYGLLSRLLAEPAGDEMFETLRALDGGDSSTPLGAALAALGAAATRMSRGAAEEAFSALFYGEGAGGEVLPYASHYLSGFLLEKPLANLRGDLKGLGIGTSGTSKEPEDHAAFVCEVMHGLITGAYGAPADLAKQKEFFAKNLAPWISLFFEDLEKAESAAMYQHVGTIGKLFMVIEEEAFEIAA